MLPHPYYQRLYSYYIDAIAVLLSSTMLMKMQVNQVCTIVRSSLYDQHHHLIFLVHLFSTIGPILGEYKLGLKSPNLVNVLFITLPT